MFHTKDQKGDAFFPHYFLCYALVLAYLLFSGCNGIQQALMPKPNLTLANLPEKTKEDYFKLLQVLDDDENKRVKQKIATITSPDGLKNFIERSLQNHIAYKALLALLPKPERTVCKQKLAKAVAIDDQAMLIDQISSTLKMIKNATILTQQHYIDLLEILPDHKAIALKNNIVHATTPDEVEHLIAAELPNPFKTLDDSAKKQMRQLSPDRRQKLLKELLLSTQLNINTLVEQKVKEQQAQAAQQNQDEAIPQDEWGPKLPLEGNDRKQFLLSILPFNQEDQKYLMALFKQTDEDSIEAFLYAYFEAFDTSERIKLLETMIYLYRKNPSLTITLCNRPDLLTMTDKLLIRWIAGGPRTKLLSRLDAFLA